MAKFTTTTLNNRGKIQFTSITWCDVNKKWIALVKDVENKKEYRLVVEVKGDDKATDEAVKAAIYLEMKTITRAPQKSNSPVISKNVNNF